MVPPGWQNPVIVPPGQLQTGVDPKRLLPARPDLLKARLEFQRTLLLSGQTRFSPVQVTRDGVIYDGHHWIRAAAEEGKLVDILIVDQVVPAAATSIMLLHVR